MAHHVYNTEGFVLDSSNSSEANKMFTIFTRELGMIRGSAQGVRLLKSKLRFSLQDFSYTKVSVVRGKDIWRITNAKSEWSLFEHARKNRASLHVVAHICMLLRRLIPGEEKNEELFSLLLEAFSFFKEQDFDQEHMNAFERILVLNILHSLGYMGNTRDLAVYIPALWTEEMLQRMITHKKQAVEEINKSLKETQL